MRNTFLYLILFLGISSCKEKFTVPLKSSEISLLVVEGNLDCTPGSTTNIRLTRSYKLENSASIAPVVNAQIFVEGKDNTTRVLQYTSAGNYAAKLPYTINQEYRIRIQTPDGKQYISDYVVAKSSPAIDSITFKNEKGGVKLFINTHDPSNKSRYYRWDYSETWEINSHYYSLFKFENNKVIERTPSEMVYQCWKYQSSNKIILASSAQLQSDIIYQYPINTIEAGSEKFSVRYSILAKQYVLSKQEYEYMQLMQKNSESLGSVFDAQPSELRGNIHCTTNPEEQVIGFLTASSVAEKRLFIKYNEVPWTHFYMYCMDKEVKNNPDSIAAEMPSLLPIDAVYNSGGMITAWLSGTPACVDCRLRGGNTTKPSYW